MEEFGFEMPTPCVVCGETFDLNDGRCSEKWHKNTTICESCWEKEQEEIEEDELFEDANLEISNALWLFKDRGAWERLSSENRKLIIQNVTHSALFDASKAILDNIETWLDTGDPADSKTSKVLYDNLKKAVVDFEHCG